MNILINNFLIILFIIIVFYITKTLTKKCDNIHYVPIYDHDEVYKQQPIPTLIDYNTKKLPQHVTVTNMESIPLYPTRWYSDGF